ncbi:Cu(I)/Ag(I) efflux system membrane fusion protein [Winogradskyella wandonensis]|uniref:Cu(I)/Ag(I) efflux system membrane fusion protein n=1 Tax=Winogradskyella wandonensis TaxID=1442586 RepID=A0A4R1KW50_9FLAO|nr:efflux RND transporter periplasmic adaptor subunit [Winogradskyella wandonensis]TCK69425.1 Cu(I)/Ag(I) efflux system membrane fusion protein [Winogradskyella wandonensis]
MKNNKIVIYIGILAIGLLLGWLLFGGSSKEEADHNHDEKAETNQMWTCSMHPQIMQPEAGDCPICGMDLIPAEAGADGLAADQFKLTANAMALANIQTSVIGKGNAEGNTIKLSGKIAENEESNAVQVSYFSGRIERLNINFTGEEVRKGQLLATIYSPELYAAQQELITAASLKESQPALYKAVRNKLKLWKLSENHINQIEETGKVKENFPVYATVSGTVTEKLVEQGDYIKQGQPLLKIANLNTVWANFDVYENQIDLFKKGQEVLVTTNAYANKEFKGRVDFIDPILNTKTRTVTLRVVLNNKEDVFKPGMFVSAKINGVLNKNKKVLSIPASAVLWTGERSVVYLKTSQDQPVFEMREVKLGNQTGNEYEVLEGLFAGNEIVTNGTFTVDAAAQLQGKKSMMNKDGGKVMTGHEGHTMDMMTEKVDFNSTVEKSFQAVIEAYINLKDALIQSDVSLASSKSEAFRKALEEIPPSQREETHNYWSILHKTSKGINENVSLEHQRKQFQTISDKLIEMVKNFDKVNDKLYVQFCPMADSNNGAYWLSKEEQVLNPYFGDVMLKCGEVKQTIE